MTRPSEKPPTRPAMSESKTGDGTRWLTIAPIGAQLPGNAKRADADFIVLAVNAHEELVAAATKFLAFYNDLAKSNPGFMGKLCLQDYAQWNEAMIELPAALRRARGEA